jgi:hypothetical protein
MVIGGSLRVCGKADDYAAGDAGEQSDGRDPVLEHGVLYS